MTRLGQVGSGRGTGYRKAVKIFGGAMRAGQRKAKKTIGRQLMQPLGQAGVQAGAQLPMGAAQAPSALAGADERFRGAMGERSDWGSPEGRTIADWARNLLPLSQVASPAGAQTPPPLSNMSVPQAQPPVNPLVQGMMDANPSMVGPGRTHQDIANRSTGAPHGYAQAGVNPAVGNPQGMAQPTLNPLGGGTGQGQLRAARNKKVGANMVASALPFGLNEAERARWIGERPLSPAVAKWNQENADPARTHALDLPRVMPLTAEGIAEGYSGAGEKMGGMTKREFLDARKARLTDQAGPDGENATYVGPLRGKLNHERNLSTTEMMRQKAELPEGAEGQADAQTMLGRMERRFAEKQEAKTPLSLRRAMVTAKAQGRPLTPFGAGLEEAVAGGEALPPDQRAAAFGGPYAAAMQPYNQDVMDTQGRWRVGEAYAGTPTETDAAQRGRFAQGLMPPGMGGSQQQLPTEGPLRGLTPEQSTMVQELAAGDDPEALERYLRLQSPPLPREQIEELLQVASGRESARIGRPGGGNFWTGENGWDGFFRTRPRPDRQRAAGHHVGSAGL